MTIRITPILAALILLVSAAPSGAQQRMVASTLALVRLPVPSYAWTDDPDGAKAAAVEADAATYGRACTPVREYHAWQVATGDEAMSIYEQTNTAFETAGWQLQHGADREDGSEPMLATRGDAQLVVGWYPMIDRQALGMLICQANAAAAAEQPAVPQPLAPATPPDNGADGEHPADPAGQEPRLDEISTAGLVIFGIGLLFIAIGAVIGGWAVHQRRRAAASRTWPEVPARIVSSYMVTEEDRDSDGDEVTWYVPKVRYVYDVGGATYEADRIHFGSARRARERDAMAVVESYPAGRTVNVRVDPANPNTATIETKGGGLGMTMVVSLAFLLFGALAMGFIE